METTNYTNFKLVESNRDVSKGLVKRIEKSIKELGYVKSRPILVNSNFEIIDGQHRFNACKNLGLPIHYEVFNGDSETDNLMIKLNSVQQVWSVKDYCNHYAKKGVAFYIEVIKLQEDYKLGISNTLTICAKSKGGGFAKEVHNGLDFKLNEKRYFIIDFVQKYHLLNYNKTHHFVSAIKILIDKCDKKQIDKLEKSIMSIPQQPNVGTYLNVFENIINKGVRDPAKLIFLR